MPRRRRVLTPDVFGAGAGRWIATQRLLGATFMLAIALATVGRTGGGLPPPRRYAAVALLWFLFGLAAELGGQVARFVGGLSALVVLAMAMGTAGRRALAWLSGQAVELGAREASQAELAGASPAAQGFGGAFTPGPRRSRGGAGGGGGAW